MNIYYKYTYTYSNNIGSQTVISPKTIFCMPYYNDLTLNSNEHIIIYYSA